MKNNVFRCTVVMVLFLFGFSAPVTAGGFLKVSGKYIVNDQNQEVLLRGIGLGGWLLPEGYMLGTSSFANAFWEIKNKVTGAVGQANADSFWAAYRKNFVTRKDIEQLSVWGFNSTRMVLHYADFMSYTQTGYDWKEEGFTIVDSVLHWCADNNIYLILDLHAAPGGQSANNISDYNSSLLSLWESDKNKTMTVDLWRKLAERYKDEPWIGGYDILNEPAWTLNPNNQPLRDLSIAITNAIRETDSVHIVFVEGNWYATDFNGMTPPWDANMVYSFHKYWNGNDLGSINYLLALRNTYNRPLWLGESGENSNTWFTDCISLMESNKIGWSWWTIKKFETAVGPLSVPNTPGYTALLNYWKGQGSKPSVDNAMKGLMGMAEGLKLENCVYHPDVIDAMLRQPNSNTTKPFAPISVPGKIFMSEYDMGKLNIAYKDNDYQNNQNNGAAWNSGWVYRNDGVDIEKCSDTGSNGYDVGWINTGEYLTFTVNVQQSGQYTVALRVAANDNGGYAGMSWDGNPQTLTAITKTGGWQSWQTQSLGTVNLTAGTHTLKMSWYIGNFNAAYVEAVYAGPLSVEEDNRLPEKFELSQNYPNPFNPNTMINYQLPMNSYVSLKVYDVIGEEAAVLVNGMQSAGKHAISFNAAHLSSGIYFYTLKAGAFTETKKFILLQ